MRRHPRGYPRATGCAARWLQSSAGGLGGRSPSQVPHPQCPLQTEATAAQEHSLETKYGKSCGSRASVLSYVGKFHQSSFPLQCYLDLQCPSEHSECRTAKLLQEQEGRWSRALHQLLLYHDDGCSENRGNAGIFLRCYLEAFKSSCLCTYSWSAVFKQCF